ncbi:MAG: MscL family protein, partial [Clostridia bacterium]|nr:MscL family protein [Clostridia bacterium]
MFSNATTADGAIDLANSIYIDWGAFISAIINFLLIAFVLFFIVRTMNRVSEGNSRFMKKLQKGWIPKEDRKELKKLGIKLYEEDKVKEYMANKQAKIDEEKRQAELKAQEEKKN